MLPSFIFFIASNSLKWGGLRKIHSTQRTVIKFIVIDGSVPLFVLQMFTIRKYFTIERTYFIQIVVKISRRPFVRIEDERNSGINWRIEAVISSALKRSRGGEEGSKKGGKKNKWVSMTGNAMDRAFAGGSLILIARGSSTMILSNG